MKLVDDGAAGRYIRSVISLGSPLARSASFPTQTLSIHRPTLSDEETRSQGREREEITRIKNDSGGRGHGFGRSKRRNGGEEACLVSHFFERWRFSRERLLRSWLGKGAKGWLRMMLTSGTYDM